MKRPTWILLLIFLALVALMVYLNRQSNLSKVAESTPVQAVEFLLADTDGLPTRIAIRSNLGEEVELTRGETGEWELVKPIKTGANQGSAEAASSQLTSLRILSKLDGVSLVDAGLDPPQYDISIEFTSGNKKSVRIGDLTPTNSGYYASLDSTSVVMVLDQAGVQALLNLVASPPYLLTPTPAAPTESP